ncbi:hypothetical protein D1841_01845 [Neglecta sp. X4]|nr:hypothetical protein [Neglectibacter sp. 59]NBJ72102.1 hypothetical protein [Neglectibacter sp. X4]NCE79878.1 hypothetical protein [Neglectibacter sp. X58]
MLIFLPSRFHCRGFSLPAVVLPAGLRAHPEPYETRVPSPLFSSRTGRLAGALAYFITAGKK